MVRLKISCRSASLTSFDSARWPCDRKCQRSTTRLVSLRQWLAPPRHGLPQHHLWSCLWSSCEDHARSSVPVLHGSTSCPWVGLSCLNKKAQKINFGLQCPHQDGVAAASIWNTGVLGRQPSSSWTIYSFHYRNGSACGNTGESRFHSSYLSRADSSRLLVKPKVLCQRDVQFNRGGGPLSKRADFGRS
jgi:hypothetical protein